VDFRAGLAVGDLVVVEGVRGRKKVSHQGMREVGGQVDRVGCEADARDGVRGQARGRAGMSCW
jgi:hypothetical protein